MTHRGPNDRGTFAAPGRRARRSPAQHRRRRGRPSAVLERGRARLGDPERRALQPRRASGMSSRRDGHRFASRCDTEIIPHLYERRAGRVPRAAPGKFGDRGLGRARAARGPCARPARGQAALLRARSATCSSSASELKSVLASGLVTPSSTTRRSTPTSRSASFPGRSTPLARRAQAAARPSACRRRSGARSASATGRIRSPRRSRAHASSESEYENGCSTRSRSRFGCA